MTNIKVGDLVCLKCHKSFFDPHKPYLAESYGTGHIPVGIVMDVYHRTPITTLDDTPAISHATVRWQKKSPKGHGGPGNEQKISALAKL